MVTITNRHFDAGQICESGQCFRMTRLENGRYGLTARDRYLEIEQREGQIRLYCTEKEFAGFWEEYFDLKTDYSRFLGGIDRSDAYLRGAAAFGSGIRILKQDLWEMIISFIISQQNNIKRIRRCIGLLCEKYGEEKRTREGHIYYAFPEVSALARAAEEDLRACNLGYRARYIKNTAESIRKGEVDLEAVRRLSYAEAKAELRRLSGVGDKVADCICLFALHCMDAFPVDTHISQALTRQYPQGFPHEEYPGCGGVMQQYIFFYELKGAR